MKYIYLMKHWNSLYKDRRSLMNTMVRHITQCYGLAWEEHAGASRGLRRLQVAPPASASRTAGCSACMHFPPSKG